MKHIVKIKQEYLDNIRAGKKKCEIRFNDRDYQVGDEMLLNGIDDLGITTLDKLTIKIIHIHSGYGMAERFVAISFEEIRREE
jgi:ASC-1-like (ASCH) protein